LHDSETDLHWSFSRLIDTVRAIAIVVAKTKVPDD
jgi:hypothetical protein